MVDIHSSLRPLRLGEEKRRKKERRKKKKKLKDENIMSTSAMQGGHKHRTKTWLDTYEVCTEMQPVTIKWLAGCSMPRNTTSL